MMHFAHIENLFWLLLPLAGLGLLFLYMRWRKNALNRIAEPSLQKLVLPGFLKNKHRNRGVFLLMAICFLIFALANLQAGKKPRKATRAGLDLVIAVDISKSMDAQDLKPSRMAQAKHFMQQLINALPQDRVGMVVFAGNAYIQMPLSSDLQAASMFVNTISTDIAPTQGTSLTDAIAQSLSLLYPKNKPKDATSAKVIVLLSDGENHEDDATEAAKNAQKSGAIIYTIGIGTTQGTVIPLGENGGLLRDENDEAVISKLNQSILQSIAAEANGKYYYLAGENDAVKKLVNELGQLKRGEKETMVFDEYESYFQVFAALALLLLLTEPLLTIFGKRNP
ncbi:MAG: vWA domain-containing protein [Bacteroidia bacterium]